MALALVRGALYATIVPPWQSPDETGHFEYVWLLAHLRRMPTRQDLSPGFEGQLIDSLYRFRFGDYTVRSLPEERPERLSEFPLSVPARRSRPVLSRRSSLAYIVQALATLPLLHKGLEAQLYAVRLSCVVLNGFIVGLTYVAARMLFPGRPLFAILAVAIVLLNPMHTYNNATAGDDTLAEAMACMAIYGWIAAFRRGLGGLEAFAIASGTVGASMSKNAAVFMLPAGVILTVWWLARWLLAGARGRGWRWRQAAWLAALLLLLAGGTRLWLQSPLGAGALRYWELFSDPAGWVVVDDRGTTLGQALLDTYSTFWGNFGWLNLPLSTRLHGAILGVSVLALLGWLLGKQRVVDPRKQGAPPEPIARWAPAMMLLLVAAALVVYTWFTVLRREDGGFLTQGRYLFPAVIPWACLLAGGWGRLLGRQREGMFVAFAVLAALDAWAMMLYIVPYYYG